MGQKVMVKALRKLHKTRPGGLLEVSQQHAAELVELGLAVMAAPARGTLIRPIEPPTAEQLPALPPPPPPPRPDQSPNDPPVRRPGAPVRPRPKPKE